jgi:predicted DNA-binding transcriptional regulator YafY
MGERRVDVLERQAAVLLYLLGESGPRTRAVIEQHVPGYPPDPESARRQFERDKQALLANDVPLRIVEHADDWTYEVREADFYLPDLQLTNEEQLALELTLSAVNIGGAPAHNLLRKDGAGVDGAVGTMGVLPDEELLPLLFAARREHAFVTLTYNGERRRVDPWTVFFNNGFWYLAGFDHLRGDQRTFRVDRIDDGSVTVGDAGAFEVRASFDAATVLPAPWQLPGDEPVTAVVRVARSIARYVADSMGDTATVSAPAADGSVTIEFEVRNRGAFKSWLFGWLDDAEVLGPPSLRDDVVAWLRAMVTA